MDGPHGRPRGKRLLFALATAVLVLATIELGAMFTLRLLGRPLPLGAARSWSEVAALIPDAEIERIRRDHYDSLLGWDVRPDFRGTRRNWSYRIDALGARRDHAWPLERRISSYGDSFTFDNHLLVYR